MLDPKRREFIALVGGGGLLLAAKVKRARGQQPAMPVIGFLNTRAPEQDAHLLAAFRQGLTETGYVDGQNVAIEYRWAEAQNDRLPAMADDLVHRQVAVIAATSTPAALAAKAATAAIPIVFETSADLVQLGFVASLSRPGGNVTGVTQLNVMYFFREFVQSGGLLSYSSDLADMYRRAAAYVDKILKGARPAELPVQSAEKFELAVNLKTAKALGLTISESFLLRAGEVIE
jgi:ABC-type uncharacterized transport system substrate-binding protein